MGKLFIAATALLCLFCVFGHSSFNSKANVIINPEKGMLYSPNKIIFNPDCDGMFKMCYGLSGVISPRKLEKSVLLPVYMAIDNNFDYLADTPYAYKGLIPDNKSNAYIVVSLLKNREDKYNENKSDGSKNPGTVNSNEKEFSVNGITYKINADKTATVVSIKAKGKVKINTVSYNGTKYAESSISAGACKNNSGITTLEIGSNVKSIGKNAFKSCKKLRKVSIKANKKLNIGKSAFSKLSKKATINISGVKGNTKKKLIKAIKKQTNAAVK